METLKCRAMSSVGNVIDMAYSSSSTSSIDTEDEFGEFIIMCHLYEHYQCYKKALSACRAEAGRLASYRPISA